ncbi:MAG: FMN-binding protein [Treponema sp.]|jgi:uncharacterized protein with FMN-binding domain|nr:FMN-binding protein [Treponema sp.]
MKNALMCVLALTLAGFFAGCLSSAQDSGVIFEHGLYEGSGRGYRGQIYVRLQVGAAGIEDITIISHMESQFPGVAAMEELLDQVLEHGFTDLDVVVGATFSSRGFLQAVENALQKARAQ